jgi:hypothetical protein
MSDQSRSYAERVVIYAMLGVAAVVWIVICGAVFLGIVQNTGA